MSEGGIRFVYRNAAGAVSRRNLVKWSEVGHYIEGFEETAGKSCTFRQDRVVEYLEGGAALLRDPGSTPPPRVRTSTPKDACPQILFTGFPAVQRANLKFCPMMLVSGW